MMLGKMVKLILHLLSFSADCLDFCRIHNLFLGPRTGATPIYRIEDLAAYPICPEMSS